MFPVGFEMFVSMEFYLNDLIAFWCNDACNTSHNFAIWTGTLHLHSIHFVYLILLVNFYFEIALLIRKIQFCIWSHVSIWPRISLALEWGGWRTPHQAKIKLAVEVRVECSGETVFFFRNLARANLAQSMGRELSRIYDGYSIVLLILWLSGALGCNVSRYYLVGPNLKLTAYGLASFWHQIQRTCTRNLD